MEKKIPFASDVILIDAAFLDRVGKDMAAHFAPLVGRELPKADLAVLLECLVWMPELSRARMRSGQKFLW